MSATKHPSHPSNYGRGPSDDECPAFRKVDAPLMDGPRGHLAEVFLWKVDCALKPDKHEHTNGLHTDPSGRFWNDAGEFVEFAPVDPFV